MVKVDLITGFLGSGKTTFLKGYLNHLKAQGLNVHIIENEFGMVNVDAAFLKSEEEALSSLAGVCMCCDGKDAFRQMLVNAAHQNIDRILVEPSGIYDVDEFFQIMQDEIVQKHCCIGSIITIIDADLSSSLTAESEYLVFSQILAAGTILFSKTQLIGAETLLHTQDLLRQLFRSYLPDADLPVLSDNARCFTKSWSLLTDEEYSSIAQSGYQMIPHERQLLHHQTIYETRESADLCKGESDLRNRLNELFHSGKYGTILRVKGHIQTTEKEWYQINCTPGNFSVEKCNVRRGLFVVIGQNIKDEALARLFLSRREHKFAVSSKKSPENTSQ